MIEQKLEQDRQNLKKEKELFAQQQFFSSEEDIRLKQQEAELTKRASDLEAQETALCHRLEKSEPLFKLQQDLEQERISNEQKQEEIMHLQNQLQVQLAISQKYGFDPVRDAFKSTLKAIKRHHKDCSKLFPTCYICYAWYEEAEIIETLHKWLKRLQHDLKHAGITVFLDVRSMQLNMDETMKKKIESSDYIFVICTPRLKKIKWKMGLRTSYLNCSILVT